MFAVRDLSVLCYTCGFTLWHYRAGSAPLEEVFGPRFFDPAAELLSRGDMCLVSADRAGALGIITATTPHVVIVPLSQNVGTGEGTS